MKNAIIFHGAGDSPDSYWIPYIRDALEEQGYQVWAPQLPSPDKPSLDAQLPYVLKTGKFEKDTIMIGHSAGCPLILAVLEEISVSISKSILVSGFAAPLSKVDMSPILKKEYGWQTIRKNCSEFVFINSDNDPWGCDDRQGRFMFDKLGGTQIILHGEGHMGSMTYDQPYKEFPLLRRLI